MATTFDNQPEELHEFASFEGIHLGSSRDTEGDFGKFLSSLVLRGEPAEQAQIIEKALAPHIDDIYAHGGLNFKEYVPENSAGDFTKNALAEFKFEDTGKADGLMDLKAPNTTTLMPSNKTEIT